MRILMPGGSGQMGSVLARRFHEDGHSVVVVSRSPTLVPWKVTPWDGKSIGAWADALEGADIVLNLAGRSVDCRFNDANHRAITNSRPGCNVGAPLRDQNPRTIPITQHSRFSQSWPGFGP